MEILTAAIKKILNIKDTPIKSEPEPLNAFFKGISRKDLAIDNSKDSKTFFSQLIEISKTDVVAYSLDKTVLSLCAGFTVQGGNDEITTWSSEMVTAITHELFVCGTVVIIDGTVIPIENCTLYPEIVTQGKLIMGEVVQVVIDEKTPNETKKGIDEFVLVRYNAKTNRFKDRLGQDTYGIYGKSLLAPIKFRVEMYYSILKSFDKFMQRFGFGRLLVSSNAVVELMKMGNVEEAKELFEKVVKRHEELSANEDIVGSGLTVSQLETHTGIDIVSIKESLENDIASMLLSSALMSGKEAGTTYASAKVIAEARELIFATYRKLLVDAMQKVIYQKFKKNVKCEFIIPAAKPTSSEVIELTKNEIITIDESRTMLGLAEITEELNDD